MLPAEFGRSTSNSIDINRGKTKNWGSLEHRPYEGLTVTSFPRMLVMLLRFTTKGVHIMLSPKIGERWGSPHLQWGRG